MPIKLTSREFKTIAVVIVMAGASLAIGIKYFWRAFPEAAIEFRVSRDDSEPIAKAYLAARGIRLQGYRHAAIFTYDDEAKVYMERSQGLERMTNLTQGPVKLWRWTHRWFKAQQKEEYRVDVTPMGDVVGFVHEVEEKTPGANLEPAAAQSIAETFLGDVMKRSLQDLEFVESQTTKRDSRTDHSFTWKDKNVNIGDGSLRVEVEVDGDQVAGYREFVKVPDQWGREYRTLRSRNEAAQNVDQFFMIFLVIAMLILLVIRVRDRDIPVRLAAGFALIGTALYFLGQLNNFSIEQFGYQTTDPYSSFLTRYFLESFLLALGVGAFIFFLVASSEPVYREAYPGLQSVRRTLTWAGLRSRSFFMANVVGIGLTFFFFAYQTIFYLVANRLGAWAPAEVNYSDLLNTRIPWVWVLFIGFLPSVFEEMMFRAFAIAFLRKLLRSLPLAIVLAAFIWGFGHAAYPNQPFYIRGLEVGLGGIVIGIIMLRFGIVATMIWHYSVDALYTAFLLLRSHNHYLMASGGITAGIMLVPLGLALIAYLKTGTFAEEESLTNASVGVSRAPRVISHDAAVTPLRYQPLSNARLALAGCLFVVFVVISFVNVYQFGEGIRLRTTREDAYRLADDFLKARHIDPASYHRVAVLDENVDGLAIRYLLERRPLDQTDRIYRSATRVLLWEVRYFRPLEKEEHHIYVDADGGRVFDYQHELSEDAPGASLSMDTARAIAEKHVSEEGYRLDDFELHDSDGKKEKARQDYTFVWQAKPGDSRNVGEARYRIQVQIAGDQVVQFSRFFKLPDDWVRQREARRISAILLGIAYAILAVVLVGSGIIILVKQIKNGLIPWRPAAAVGAAVAVIIALTELNSLSTVERLYDTSNPITLFRLTEAVGLSIVPVMMGLVSWLMVGLGASLYPDAWRIFTVSARRIWRRDAAVAILVSLAAGAAVNQIGGLIANHFHADVPVDIGIVPNGFDTSFPAAVYFLGGLSSSIFRTAALALVIYIVRVKLASRILWLGIGAVILLASLGPSGAHSVREYFLGWALGFLTLVLAVSILILFCRNNILAYVGGGFLMSTLSPLASLLSQPNRFFVWNGIVLGLLILGVLVWLFALGQKTTPVQASPAKFIDQRDALGIGAE